MTEVLRVNIRKKGKANITSLFLALSIVCFVCLIINLWTGSNSPMWSMNSIFFVGIIGFLILGVIVSYTSKLVMKMSMDEEKRFYISVPFQDGTEIKLDNVSTMEPVYGRVSYGRGPKSKDTYLKLYDEHGDNLLTLFTTYGALQDKPNNFFQLSELEILTYDKGLTVYATTKVQDIYDLLKESRHITVKRPTV